MKDGYRRLRSGSDILGVASGTSEAKAALTRDVAERVGYAFALWLAKDLGTTADKLTIAVGRDPRLSGEGLMQAVIHGLTIADCDVLDCGLCATPAMFQTTLMPEAGADGAVMVTAAHHPWHMNGFKLIGRARGLRSLDIDEILEMAHSVELPQRLVTGLDFLSVYKQMLGDMVRRELATDVQCPLLGLHVVVDASSGSGGFYADLLEELGAEVTGSINLLPDGHFPSHVPGVEDKAALEALSKAVTANTADVGVLLDAGCDRATLVDETGQPIHKNRLIALIAAILLEESPGATIVTDSVTSTGLQRFITEWGGLHYRFKRGYRDVIDEAIRLNDEGIDCPLAIETSGHAAFRENHFLDDGMYLVTRILCEALRLKREGLTLGSLIAELSEPVESLEIRLKILPDDTLEAAQSVIETVLSHTLDNPAWRLAMDNREGVRITLDLGGETANAWFMLRLSVHDPVMPLNAESDVPGGIKRMLLELYELIKDSDCLDLDPLREAIEIDLPGENESKE